MDHIEAIEAAPSFHARVMNVQSGSIRNAPSSDIFRGWYDIGHRDARHAAAEIAAEADAQIANLLDRLREAEADARRYRWLRDRPEPLGYMQTARALGLDLTRTYVNTPEKLDSVIDAAMSTKEAP